MDFNEVYVFIRVVQKGSFSKAALTLGMPKSTVSTKISNLEKRIGVTLIKRTTRQLQLTKEGEIYFQRVTMAMNEIIAADLQLRSEIMVPQGRLRISAPADIGGYILTELISDYLKIYPKVNFEIFLSDRYVNFLEEDIDLALRIGELKDSTLIARKVGEVGMGIFASTQYLKPHARLTKPSQLAEHKCILFSSLPNLNWKLTHGSSHYTISPRRHILVNDLKMAHSFALRGQGLALLPSFLCVDDMKTKKLIRVLKQWSTQHNPIHFVYPHQRYVSPTVKSFIEFAAPIMKNRFSIGLD